MFQSYSFQAASQHPSRFTPLDTQSSPFTTCASEYFAGSRTPDYPYGMPSPTLDVDDLASQFSHQNLEFNYNPRTRQNRMTFFDLPTPPNEANNTHSSYHTSPQSPPPQPQSHLDTTSRLPSPRPPTRSQRQQATRLQCQSHHIQAIRSLASRIDRMIDQRDQCAVCSLSPSPTLPPSSTANASGEADEMSSSRPLLRSRTSSAADLAGKALGYRRSGDLRGNGVSKQIRIRKRKSERR